MEQDRKEIEKKISLMKDNCIFCKIVKREVESHIVFEDEKCMSILDISPASKGHLLLLPKEHFPILQSLPDDLLGHLSSISTMLAELLKKTFNAVNVKILIANGLAAGQNSQHFMLHIIPEYENQKIKLNFKEGKPLPKEELETLQKNFKTRLEELNKKLEKDS